MTEANMIEMVSGDPGFQYHQLFLTASPVLRDQVRKSFHALKASSFPHSMKSSFAFPRGEGGGVGGG